MVLRMLSRERVPRGRILVGSAHFAYLRVSSRVATEAKASEAGVHEECGVSEAVRGWEKSGAWNRGAVNRVRPHRADSYLR